MITDGEEARFEVNILILIKIFMKPSPVLLADHFRGYDRFDSIDN